MAFLTGRMLLWVGMSAAALGVVAALYFGAVNKGKRLNDAKWRSAVSDEQQRVRDQNHDINMNTLEREADLAAKIREIYQKWTAPQSPSQE